MPEAVEIQTEGSLQTENVVDNVIETVKNGRADEFLQNFWEGNRDNILHFGKIILLAAVVLMLTWLISRLCGRLIFRSTRRFGAMDESVSRILGGVCRGLIWVLGVLIVLDLFGINTASILTILGAAGLGVALAMKDSLSNIAAGLMLIFLRPYKTGDFVECGSVSGTIKQMGLFCTELMTLDGMFVAVPNSVLFGAPIKNYSRNAMRRADITVGISYGSSLSEGVAVLKKLLDDSELVAKDPAPQVLVSDLAESAVTLTLRFWVENDRYWEAYWMVKASLKPTLEGAGLTIPFPQRVVTFANALPEKRD